MPIKDRDQLLARNYYATNTSYKLIRIQVGNL